MKKETVQKSHEMYKKKIEEAFGKHSCHVLKIRKYGAMKVEVGE